jgi:hypothetical protein
LAVAHAALVILDHALQYRAAQVTRVGSIRVSQSRQRVYEKTQQEVKDVEEIVLSQQVSFFPLNQLISNRAPFSMRTKHGSGNLK